MTKNHLHLADMRENDPAKHSQLIGNESLMLRLLQLLSRRE
jgi:hypothetical protein